MTALYNLIIPIISHRKIYCIKFLRMVTGLGLRDAKRQIDYWETGARGWMDNKYESEWLKQISNNKQKILILMRHFKEEAR